MRHQAAAGRDGLSRQRRANRASREARAGGARQARVGVAGEGVPIVDLALEVGRAMEPRLGAVTSAVVEPRQTVGLEPRLGGEHVAIRQVGLVEQGADEMGGTLLEVSREPRNAGRFTQGSIRAFAAHERRARRVDVQLGGRGRLGHHRSCSGAQRPGPVVRRPRSGAGAVRSLYGRASRRSRVMEW
jgi:hypothetical protein